jgi:kinesin family member 18/19
MEETFKVYVRIRPCHHKEDCSRKILEYDQSTLKIIDGRKEYVGMPQHIFTYNRVFGTDSSNKDIYQQSILPNINGIFKGYNYTAFAYGITGSGKTHTMLGIHNKTEEVEGLCEMMVNDIMAHKPPDLQIFLSYIEIYNEQVKDLLSKADLTLMEDPIKGTILLDLMEKEISSKEEFLSNLKLGNSRRKMASTGNNAFSSRSHAIIQISLKNTKSCVTAKINMVDLAGSEKAYSKVSESIKRNFEGSNINKSLLALGNCINILSEKSKKASFIPYRNSKLTRILKDSLGGNTKVSMIACIGPSYLYYEETLNTLKYAERASRIKKKISLNSISPHLNASQYMSLVETLKSEISSLKEQLQNKVSHASILSTQMNTDKGTSLALSPINVKSTNKENSCNTHKKAIDESKSIDPVQLGELLVHNIEEKMQLKSALKEFEDLKEKNESALKAIEQGNYAKDSTTKIEGIDKMRENYQYNITQIENELKRNEQEKGKIEICKANIKKNEDAESVEKTILLRLEKLEKLFINQIKEKETTKIVFLIT